MSVRGKKKKRKDIDKMPDNFNELYVYCGALLTHWLVGLMCFNSIPGVNCSVISFAHPYSSLQNTNAEYIAMENHIC